MTVYDQLYLVAYNCETRKINICESYVDWLSVGFCCASFGEFGRKSYHVFSRLSTKYNEKECNSQFDACLKSVKDSCNLRPILSMTKNHGLLLRDLLILQSEVPVKKHIDRASNTMYTSDANFSGISWLHLPCIFKEVVNLFDEEELKELSLLTVLTAVSSFLSDVTFLYDGKIQPSHLYLCCVAPAASGKSVISDLRVIFNPLQDYYKNLTKLEKEDYILRYKNTKKDERDLLKPARSFSFFIPADTSTPALLANISDNGGKGIIWESEIDTFLRIFKSDLGNFSDILRNNFHSEVISYSRKQDREYIELRDTKFALIMSGTPLQVHKFFKDIEDGLFSRFIFNSLDSNIKWLNKWHIESRKDQLKAFGEYFFYVFNNRHPLTVNFSKDQQKEHFEFFSQLQTDYDRIGGHDTIPVVRRLSLIQLRIASLLSYFRSLESQDKFIIEGSFNCTSFDWLVSRQIIERAVSESVSLMQYFENTTVKKKKNERDKIYTTLPEFFNLDVFPSEMSRATVYRWVDFWIREHKIIKVKNGYRKVF